MKEYIVSREYDSLVETSQKTITDFRNAYGGKKMKGSELIEFMGITPEDVSRLGMDPCIMITHEGYARPLKLMHREIMLLEKMSMIASISMN